jgi:acyl carrier protein
MPLAGCRLWMVKLSDGNFWAAWKRRGERMDDVASRIIELVAKSKNLPVADVRMDSTFDELQVDSLDKINLSFAVEEMFSIEIPDESLNSLKTVGDVVGGVETLRAAKGEGATS